jgi:hypothetical protein
MREIADKMRRAADMDALMQITVKEMAKALGTPNTFVQLAEPSTTIPDMDGNRA